MRPEGVGTEMAYIEDMPTHFCTVAPSEDTVVQKIRDLSVIRLPDHQLLVIACDSNASIGEKPMDYQKHIYREVAVSALKVPMMEVLATGATPLLVVDNLCVEMDGAGCQIIKYMRQELQRHGFLENVQLTGSTEDNMPTCQTALGVTVIGILHENGSRIGRTREKDAVVCVGIPRRDHYSEFQEDVASIGTVKRLLETDFVHEILPIGSKGAAYEANQLCETAGLLFKARRDVEIDLNISAGSSTAVLCSLCPEDFPRLEEVADRPCFLIGTTYKEKEEK